MTLHPTLSRVQPLVALKQLYFRRDLEAECGKNAGHDWSCGRGGWCHKIRKSGAIRGLRFKVPISGQVMLEAPLLRLCLLVRAPYLRYF
jgi:hypothetical protein